MQRLEVSGAVCHIYVIRRQRVNCTEVWERLCECLVSLFIWCQAPSLVVKGIWDMTWTTYLCPVPLPFHGSTAPNGPAPPHYRDIMIILRHTTLVRTPQDEWPATVENERIYMPSCLPQGQLYSYMCISLHLLASITCGQGVNLVSVTWCVHSVTRVLGALHLVRTQRYCLKCISQSRSC
jgi:hypothetical protein